jgi:hypothetical protein
MDKKCGNGQNIKEWDYSASITIISKAIKMGGGAKITRIRRRRETPD